MTHDELMALPVNGGFDQVEVSSDPITGHRVVRPRALPAFATTINELGDILYVMDNNGDTWNVGHANGTLYRTKVRNPFA